MADNRIFRIYTHHGTQMFLDRNGRLIHRRLDSVSSSVFPVYTQTVGDGVALFVIKNSKIIYLSSLTENRKESETPIKINLTSNPDGTVSIIQGDKNLSARRENDSFVLSTNNLAWEHFTFERAEFKFTSEYIPPFVRTFETQSKKTMAPKTVPSLSVIIPMLNAESHIANCLNSVFRQSFTSYEVIVIDDCSTDNSVEIVENMSAWFSGKLKLIRCSQRSGNLGTPKNIGLNRAVGKYVFFLDVNKPLTEEAFEIMYNDAEEHEVDVDLPDSEKYCSLWRSDNLQNKFWRRDFLIENRLFFPPKCAMGGASLSRDEYITGHIETMATAFKVLNDFMNMTDFFSDHPEVRYATIKYFFEYHLDDGEDLAAQYRDNPPNRIYEITYRVMSAGANFTDEPVAIFLTVANSLEEQLVERDQRIEMLRTELDRLKQ